MLKPSQARAALVVLRLLVGVLGFLAPRATGRLFGVDPDENPSLPFVARLFAARDVTLAVGLAGADARERDRWLTLGAATDAADAVAAGLSGLRGEIPRRAALMGAATALVAVAMGVAGRGE